MLRSPQCLRRDPHLLMVISIGNTSRYDIWVNRNQPSFIQEIVRNHVVSGKLLRAHFVSRPRHVLRGGCEQLTQTATRGDWSLSRQFSIVRPTFTKPRQQLGFYPTSGGTNWGSAVRDLWVIRLADRLELFISWPSQQTHLPNDSAAKRNLTEHGSVLWVRTVKLALE